MFCHNGIGHQLFFVPLQFLFCILNGPSGVLIFLLQHSGNLYYYIKSASLVGLYLLGESLVANGSVDFHFKDHQVAKAIQHGAPFRMDSFSFLKVFIIIRLDMFYVVPPFETCVQGSNRLAAFVV